MLAESWLQTRTCLCKTQQLARSFIISPYVAHSKCQLRESGCCTKVMNTSTNTSMNTFTYPYSYQDLSLSKGWCDYSRTFDMTQIQ